MSGTDFPTVLFLVALLGNVIGIVLAGLVTVNRSRAALHAAALVFPLAWLAHLGAIVNTALAGGRLPLSNVTEYLLMLGWLVLSLHLFVWFRLKVRVAGLVLPPVAALATLVAWLAGPGQPGPAAELPPVWFLFHASVSTLGMATLCVSFLVHTHIIGFSLKGLGVHSCGCIPERTLCVDAISGCGDIKNTT